MSAYHYLVAGLSDLSLDVNKLDQSIEEFRSLLSENLSKSDKKLFYIFFMPAENKNLLAWLKDRKNAQFLNSGKLTADDFLEQWDLLDYDNAKPLAQIPTYMSTFMREWKNEDFNKAPDYVLENRLNSLYFDYACKSKNKFIRDWFLFELNLKNLEIAILCRKNKMDLNSQIVGDNEVANILKKSSARDFGISQLFPLTDQIVRIFDDKNLLEREKKIEDIKWKWLEENSFFHYFTIEQLITHLLKMQSIERWLKLDAKAGKEFFRKMIEDMKASVKKPGI